jgi:hypothetical protein
VRDLDILQAARKEAEFYVSQRSKSPATAELMKHVQADARVKLASVG